MTEADWKRLRAVKEAALQRYCERVLRDADAIVSDTTRTPHQRYLALFDLMQKRDRELANAFDEMSRSTAIYRLMSMRSLGVVTDDEMASFSPKIRDLFVGG